MRQPNCGVHFLWRTSPRNSSRTWLDNGYMPSQAPEPFREAEARLVHGWSARPSSHKLSQSHESFSRLKTLKSKICCSPSARRPLRLSRSLVRTMHIVSEIPSVSEGRHLYWAGKTSRRLRMVLSPCFLLKAWFARKVSSLGRARRHSDCPGHDVRQVFEDTNNPRRSGFDKSSKESQMANMSHPKI